MKYFITFNDGPYGDRFAVLASFDNYHVALEKAYFEPGFDYDSITICSDTGLYGELEPYYPDFSSMPKLKVSDSLLFEYCGQSDPWVWLKDGDKYIGGNYYDSKMYCDELDEDSGEDMSAEDRARAISDWLYDYGIPVKIKK